MSAKNDNEPIFYTVSEMAKIFGISNQAMRFYHREGLLTPKKIDTNGYRKYSYDQLYRLATICFLRKANCSIKDIRTALNINSYSENLELFKNTILSLKEQQNEINRQIETLQSRISFIENWINQIDTECEKIVDYPKRYYIPQGSEWQTASQEDFFQQPTIAIYNSNDNEHYSLSIGLYYETIKNQQDPQKANFVEIPEGQYLSAFIKGPYKNVFDKVQKIKKRYPQYSYGPTFYSINIIDLFIENDQNNYVVYVEIPILTPQQNSEMPKATCLI